MRAGLKPAPLLFTLLHIARASASMPFLTEEPEPGTAVSCSKWASSQNYDALGIWGIQTEGTSSPIVAIERLTRSCMGQSRPQIVGFGSSAGFDETYCKQHKAERVCVERKATGAQYGKAALNGKAEAQLALGVIYSSGRGQPVDIQRAAMWFKLASGYLGKRLTKDNGSVGQEATQLLRTIQKDLTKSQIDTVDPMTVKCSDETEMKSAMAACGLD